MCVRIFTETTRHRKQFLTPQAWELILIEKQVYIGSPQFHTPLSSIHQFHTEGPLLFTPKNPSVPHQKPLSSTQPTQFHTKNPSVPHEKPLSSTPKTPQFHTSLSSTQKTPQFQTPLSSTQKVFMSSCFLKVFLSDFFFGVELRGWN